MNLLRLIPFVAGLAMICQAGVVKELSFEQLVDGADLIVHGKVVNKTAAWDSDHQYIWTHYEIQVLDHIKGTHASTVTVSEAGGTVGPDSMFASVMVEYSAGEEVLVAVKKMPNGLYRTVGFVQGKFVVAERQQFAGKHAFGLTDSHAIESNASLQGTHLSAVQDLPVNQLKAMMRTRMAHNFNHNSNQNPTQEVK